MRIHLTVVLLAAAMLSSTASARDDHLKFPIAGAITAAAASPKAQLDPAIQLFWGNQNYPKPTQTYGTFTANKKTNFVGKTDQQACDWVWLSAVVSLQRQAVMQGGNAVVNIKSVYRNAEFVSDTEYECGAGSILGGVALRGTVVKLP